MAKVHARLPTILIALAALVVLALLLAPSALAAGAGRVLGGLWVSVMSAVTSLLGPLFGG